MTRVRGAVASASLMAMAALTISGCRNADMERALDDARSDRLDLRTEVSDLVRRNNELATSLAMAEATLREGPARATGRAVAADLPRIADIRIGRYTRLTAGRDRGILLQAWIEPRDGRGRFLQMAGTLSLHLVHIPPDRNAVTLLRVQFSADEVRDAYRSFLTGTHYAFEQPIEQIPPDGGVILLHAEYEDAWTGGTIHQASAEVRLHVR